MPLHRFQNSPLSLHTYLLRRAPVVLPYRTKHYIEHIGTVDPNNLAGHRKQEQEGSDQYDLKGPEVVATPPCIYFRYSFPLRFVKHTVGYTSYAEAKERGGKV